jgi:hypothetical protein
MEDFFNLKRKVEQYKSVLENTNNYRQTWKDSLKNDIMTALELMCKETGLNAKVGIKTGLENLEAITLSFGDTKSGMYQKVSDDIQRHMIKNNGVLIYQQLFNGKIIVLINYPFIESYGTPSPPKTIAIYRPEELKTPFLTRHLEEFVTEITNWEDYDDDEPNKRLGFELNFQTDLEEGTDV